MLVTAEMLLENSKKRVLKGVQKDWKMKLDLISVIIKKESSITVQSSELEFMKAEINVSYRNFDEDLLVCYDIVGSYKNKKLFTMEVIYKILKEDIIKFPNYKWCLNKAVDDLQERIEFILSLFIEEMGFEIAKEIS